MKTFYHQYISIVVSLLLLFAGCAPVYQLYRFEGSDEWRVKSHYNMLYDDFTVDDAGNLPTDKKLAEERFERRKEFLEEYHNIEHPVTAFLKDLPLLPIACVLFPLFIIDEYRVHVFGSGHEMHEPSEEEKRKAQERKERLRNFIIEDMRIEKRAQQKHEG